MAALAEEGQVERNLPFWLGLVQDGAKVPSRLTEVLREVLSTFVMCADGRGSPFLLFGADFPEGKC